MFHRYLPAIAAAVIVTTSAFSAQTAQAALAVTVTNDQTSQSQTSAYTIGYAFNVAAAGATVADLDYALDGRSSGTVKLYSVSTSTGTITTLASVTVTSSDTPTITIGGGASPDGIITVAGPITYYQHALATPIFLPYSSDLTYYVAGLVPVGGNLYTDGYTGNGLASDPSITFLHEVSNREANGANSTPTTDYLSVYRTNYVGGLDVNLTLGTGSAVPEPASLGLLGTGVAMLGLRRRRAM